MRSWRLGLPPAIGIQSISTQSRFRKVSHRMLDWTPDLVASDKPHYLAIADQIGAAIGSGRLTQGDRLPPQRALAKRLGLDFTTVARGYTEAASRGLIISRVGQGTFVAAATRRRRQPMATRPELVDLSMNLPPEPDDPDLLERMQDGLEAVGSELVSLMRYQGFGGVPGDKDAASVWLGHRALVPNQGRVFIAPGAHPALLAIFGLLAKPGETVLAEHLTYPGARSIAAQLGLKLVGVPMDVTASTPMRSRRPAGSTRRSCCI
jgi:DNA-binding transcriptional MocR family regulator